MSLGLEMVVPERVELSPYSFRGSWTAIIPGNNLVVQLGFEPSLRVSKTPVRPIHHWTFVKGFQSDHIGFQSCIPGLATSDIVPVLVAFSGKPIRARQSSVLPMWLFLEQEHSAQHVYIGLKRGSVCRASSVPVATNLPFNC